MPFFLTNCFSCSIHCHHKTLKSGLRMLVLLGSFTEVGKLNIKDTLLRNHLTEIPHSSTYILVVFSSWKSKGGR
jgi:hypothetical protein